MGALRFLRCHEIVWLLDRDKGRELLCRVQKRRCGIERRDFQVVWCAGQGKDRNWCLIVTYEGPSRSKRHVGTTFESPPHPLRIRLKTASNDLENRSEPP